MKVKIRDKVLESNPITSAVALIRDHPAYWFGNSPGQNSGWQVLWDRFGHTATDDLIRDSNGALGEIVRLANQVLLEETDEHNTY